MDKKSIHDFLLEHKPEEASHDVASCPFCNDLQIASSGGQQHMSDSIYSQEQVDSLVAAAVDKTVGEVTTELDKELVQVRAELEQAQETITTRDAEIVTLNTDITDRDEASRLAELGDERVALVTEVASFTDEELAQRKSRWASMSDEDFTETLADFKAISEAASVSDDSDDDDDGDPETALDITREIASEDDEDSVLGTFLSRI